MSPTARIQIEESDIISFHKYEWPENFEARIHELQQFHRPILCSEFMARGAGSTFDTILPIAQKYHVALINWVWSKEEARPICPGIHGSVPMLRRNRRSGSTTCFMKRKAIPDA